MKIFVINLDTRPDRIVFISNQLKGYDWERFSAVNGHTLSYSKIKELGFDTFNEWLDPIVSRPLTYTEIGCAISHYQLWQKCAELNEPILILEDDVELINTLNLERLTDLCKSYDIIYLDHREMFESSTTNINDELFKPYYPYWNSAYIITPALAKEIIASPFKSNLFPIDELFPLLIGVDYNTHCLGNKSQFDILSNVFRDIRGISTCAFKNKVFRQKPRAELGSDIENGKLIMNENVYVTTVATDETRMALLDNSSRINGIELINLGKGVVWEGGNMTGPGGGQKLNLMRQFLQDKNDNDIVLFVDGYDVFINDQLNEIVSRFKSFNCGVVLAAEKTCWPDKNLSSFFSADTEYKYLNSGCYIGYVSHLLALISDYIDNSEDDQLFLQKKFIVDSFNSTPVYKLDTENYIFQCIAGAENEVIVKSNKQLVNIATRCCPCILHGNGGEASKDTFVNLYERIFGNVNPNKEIELIVPQGYSVAAPDILELDFMTPETCSKLIQKAERFNKWESMYGDKFPAQELRIRELDMELFEQLEEHFKQHVYPIIEKYWWPLQMYGLRDAFIIKYSPETQASLNCHHDASLVSGNVKLNSDYTGGDTYYYRQNFSNINTPVGKIVMWPGQVTHGHEGREVTSGTKYNLVIWTSRRRGDINY